MAYTLGEVQVEESLTPYWKGDGIVLQYSMWKKQIISQGYLDCEIKNTSLVCKTWTKILCKCPMAIISNFFLVSS